MEGRRAGRAGGPCFQMEKVNFRRAGGLLHTRQKGGPAGCTKKAVRRAAEKGSPPARPYPQPSLICSPPDRLNVQPTCPSCGAACRPAFLRSSPAREKFMFFIWQHIPPARRLVLSVVFNICHFFVLIYRKLFVLFYLGKITSDFTLLVDAFKFLMHPKAMLCEKVNFLKLTKKYR